MKNNKKKLSLNSSILELNLSTRAANCLIRAGIRDINTLIYYRINAGNSLQEKNTLHSIYNIGSITLKEIIDKVHENGFLFIDEEQFNQTNNPQEEINQNIKILDDTLEQLDENSFQKRFNTLNYENKTIEERIKIKQNLFLEYKRLIMLKKELLLREAEINLQLEREFEFLNELEKRLNKKI